MFVRLFFVLPVFLLLSACQPSPTSTLEATITLTRTASIAPISPPTATATATNTPTSMSTPTATPPITLLKEELEQMTDEELIALAPEVQGLSKAEIYYKHMVYRDEYDRMREVYNFETGEWFDGLSVYEVEGLTFKAYLRNDGSLAEAGLRDYYVIQGQEERGAKAVVEVSALIWALKTGRIENRSDVYNLNLEEKFSLLDQMTSEFIQALKEGTAWEQAGGAIRYGDVTITNLAQFQNVVIEVAENSSRQLDPGSGSTIPWIHSYFGEQGRLLIRLDPSKVNQQRNITLGGVFGAIRSWLPSEINAIWGEAADMGGTIVLNLCGKRTRDFEIWPPDPEAIRFQHPGVTPEYTNNCFMTNR